VKTKDLFDFVADKSTCLFLNSFQKYPLHYCRVLMITRHSQTLISIIFISMFFEHL